MMATLASAIERLTRQRFTAHFGVLGNRLRAFDEHARGTRRLFLEIAAGARTRRTDAPGRGARKTEPYTTPIASTIRIDTPGAGMTEAWKTQLAQGGEALDWSAIGPLAPRRERVTTPAEDLVGQGLEGDT